MKASRADNRGLQLMIVLITVAVAGVAAEIVAAQEPTRPPATPSVIKAEGVLGKGVETGCRVLKTDDRKTYSFVTSKIDAKYKDGEHVCLEGTQVMGYCMQGSQLSLTSMRSCRGKSRQD